MKRLLILPDHTYAGHCTSGGSNKDWAACLAIEVDAPESSLPKLDEKTEVAFLSVHGPHGGNVIADLPKKLSMKQAQAHFTKKCREKDGKGYAHVPFLPYLSVFGSPFGLSLIVPATLAQTDGREASVSTPVATPPPSPLRFFANRVKAITWEKLQQIVTDSDYAISEKVNGERCMLVFDGEHLTAYNRQGKPMSAPPIGALHLRRLGHPFVVDGERLTRDLAGYFVAFDVLAWKGENLTASPYSMRIRTLQTTMLQAALLVTDDPTPTFEKAYSNCTVNDLALLVAVAESDISQQVIEEIQASSGEGVIARRLSGNYDESPLKFKFTADIDVFVVAVNEGLAAGSLKLGVLRPSDRAIIEVGNVRSGLGDADITAVRQMLERGEKPVFTVTYLPARTVKIQLVEPRTSMALLRSDKDAAECTTDQFGPAKAESVADASPIMGITLL